MDTPQFSWTKTKLRALDKADRAFATIFDCLERVDHPEIDGRLRDDLSAARGRVLLLADEASAVLSSASNASATPSSTAPAHSDAQHRDHPVTDKPEDLD